MTNSSPPATSEQPLLEESASLLASYAMAVRNGHMSIDEAIDSAFRSGVNAGLVQGLEDARKIIAGNSASTTGE